MLKKIIKFSDYDGNDCEEVHYFNLTRTEIIDMEFAYEGGSFASHLQRISDEQNPREIMNAMKQIVKTSYGVRSEDGKRFIKTEENFLNFSQTSAYDALFMELCYDAESAVNFIKAICPQDLTENI